jgi:hypothetical protein
MMFPKTTTQLYPTALSIENLSKNVKGKRIFLSLAAHSSSPKNILEIVRKRRYFSTSPSLEQSLL